MAQRWALAERFARPLQDRRFQFRAAPIRMLVQKPRRQRRARSKHAPNARDLHLDAANTRAKRAGRARARFAPVLCVSHSDFAPNAERLRVIFGVQNRAAGAGNAQNTPRTHAHIIWMPHTLAQNAPAACARRTWPYDARPTFGCGGKPYPCWAMAA